MSENNFLINYGEYLIATINPGRKQGKQWAYHIINLSSLIRNQNQRSSYNRQNMTQRTSYGQQTMPQSTVAPKPDPEQNSVTAPRIRPLAIIIPVCSNLKPSRIRNRSVIGCEGFTTKVGLDEDTGIYGIRFDIADPTSNIVVSFRTPRRQMVDETLGFIANGVTYKNQVIGSPGCEGE